ncbi:unnamed protein product [Euphydryas editha]|uniref:Uncharacterized protein n=1 Tax=Euphydryas editha TaxID=104508 RepID=A0AAU9VAV9_EUPED|nr:unnamed protein product [Euphydryas editha]
MKPVFSLTLQRPTLPTTMMATQTGGFLKTPNWLQISQLSYSKIVDRTVWLAPNVAYYAQDIGTWKPNHKKFAASNWTAIGRSCISPEQAFPIVPAKLCQKVF